MKTIDLHVHSNFSDGTCSPKELITLAQKNGLSAIALTDHDSINGIPTALEAVNELDSKVKLIPGAELSAEYNGKEVHIVGLFIDYKNQEFLDTTNMFVKRRSNRNADMVANFQKAGIPITLEALKEGNPDTVITRAHFARFLIEHGIAKDVKEAFATYLGETSPYYVPRVRIDAKDAIALILRSGGIPILAHPIHYKLKENDLRKMVADLKENQLVGIEVKYSNHSIQDEQFVNRLAKEFDLLPSGGSDFHGTNKPAIQLGFGRGNLQIPYEYLENLAAYANYPL